MAGDDHAVVVGIADYPKLDPLNGPENDARDFASWLEDPNGGAVPPGNIDLILSSDPVAPGMAPSPHPTMDKLDEAFERLIQASDQSGRCGRRLYVYLAGHGCAPTISEVGLLSATASPLRIGDYLAGRMYADWFRQAAFFDEVVWFMDCCRENYPRIPIRLPPWASITSTHQSKYLYGYATQHTQPSREGLDPATGQIRGLFTLALLAGLRDADRDAKGRLTSTALTGFVYNFMTREAPAIVGDVVQDPSFVFEGNREVVFESPNKAAAPPPTWTVTIKLSRTHKGKTLALLDGDLAPIAPAASGPVNWRWDALSDGLYRLRLDGTGVRFVELLGPGGAHHEVV
jgi:hypothetical protein